MKIILFQENLAKQINFASRALPAKENTLSILNSFLLEAKKELIKITASNLETTIIADIPGKILKEGKTTIPAKTLLSVLPSLRGEKLTLEVEKKLLKIKGRKTSISLKTEQAEEFPQVKTDKEGEEDFFSQELVQEVNKLVAFAASKDQTRAVLAGILLDGQDNNLNIVATDGFRLSLLKRKLKQKTLFDKVVLPAEAVGNLVQMLGENKENKKVRFLLCKDKSQMMFFLPQIKLFTRLIAGKFPDYQKIIPKEKTTKTVVDREDFLKAVKLASVFAREAANIVKLKIEKNRLFVLASSPQTGENKSEIQAKTEGEELKVAFNFRFLLDFLKAKESEQVSIESAGPLSPGVFRFANLPSFLHIIMPVRLQEA